MPVRRQYSSCDSCRTARIGCDAARTGSDGCSNCIRRRRNCTFTVGPIYISQQARCIFFSDIYRSGAVVIGNLRVQVGRH